MAFVANFLKKSTLFKNSIYNYSHDFLVSYYHTTKKNTSLAVTLPKGRLLKNTMLTCPPFIRMLKRKC